MGDVKGVAVTSSVAAGDTFAGYRVVRRIGAGGMGEVFLAEHPRLPRKDALKVLSPGFRGNGNFRRRFVREAELSASLRHPHIVPIYDCGDVGGRLWISMAYIEGSDAGKLASSYENLFMPTELVIDIIRAIAGALDYAHERGLLHRDVKPGNILVDNSARPQAYLGDFGIARPQDDSLGLTATGGFIGSVPYCAPEQFDDPRTLTAAVDQYQLACTAFELLTGAPPFGSPEPLAAMRQHLTATPPDPRDRRPGLPHSLAGVFRRALAKDPAHRYANCMDFADALAEALRSAPGSAMNGAQRVPDDGAGLRLPVVATSTDSGDRPEAPTGSDSVVLRQRSPIHQQPGPVPWPPTVSAQPPPLEAHQTHRTPVAYGPYQPTVIGGYPRQGTRVRRRTVFMAASVAVMVVVVTIAAGVIASQTDSHAEQVSVGTGEPSATGGGEKTKATDTDDGKARGGRTAIPGLTGVTDVTIGGYIKCAIAEGVPYCWGNNAHGQLGDGSMKSSKVPRKVTGLSHVSAISTDGATTCAIDSGALYCWGNNDSGQIGDGTRGGRTTPVRVRGLSAVTAVSTADGVTCAVAGGVPLCWGTNSLGGVGDGSTTDRPTPTRVKNLAGVTAVSAGASTSCAVAGGDLYCWGYGHGDRFGAHSGTGDYTTPSKVPGLTGITDFASGKSMTGFTNCAIAGGLYCWGFSDDGQDNVTASPTRIGGLPPPEAVAASHGTACAISGGGLYCWGSNDYGEIGDGTNIHRPAPTRVPGISGVTAVSTNSSMTCAVAGGKVYCWGDGRL